MRLIPLSTAPLVEQCAAWLADPRNSQWLELGHPPRLVTPALLKLMAQKPDRAIRAYTDDAGRRPIGLVGLDHVDPYFKTATVWVVLGDKAYAQLGYGTGATSKMLTIGFAELRLVAINAWVAEQNPAIGIVERLNFRYIGRQRRCHPIGGRVHDRLLFDLLASEHKELLHVPRAAYAGTRATDLLVNEP